MTKSIPFAMVRQLKRDAKRLGRTLSIPHADALDRIAVQQGFKNWSQLPKHAEPDTEAGAACAPTMPPPPAGDPLPVDRRQRRYLHGDEHEDSASGYYCSLCDNFAHPVHFLLSHGRHTGDRFLDQLEAWNGRSWMIQVKRRRPENAPNLFHKAALKARIEYQELRPAFSDWFAAQGRRMRHGERNDDVGMTAIELVSRESLPEQPRSLPQLQDHYRNLGRQFFEIQALEAAWDEFMAQRKGGPGGPTAATKPPGSAAPSGRA